MVMMLHTTRLEAITRGAPSVVAIDEDSGDLVAFVDVDGATSTAPPDGLYNPIDGDPYKQTDYELGRFSLPSGVKLANPDGDLGIDSVDGSSIRRRFRLTSPTSPSTAPSPTTERSASPTSVATSSRRGSRRPRPPASSFASGMARPGESRARPRKAHGHGAEVPLARSLARPRRARRAGLEPDRGHVRLSFVPRRRARRSPDVHAVDGLQQLGQRLDQSRELRSSPRRGAHAIPVQPSGPDHRRRQREDRRGVLRHRLAVASVSDSGRR